MQETTPLINQAALLYRQAHGLTFTIDETNHIGTFKEFIDFIIEENEKMKESGNTLATENQ